MYEKIKKLCEERGISVNGLESELDFPRGSIYKWEKSIPSVTKAKLVADYFKISIEELIGDIKDE